MAETQGTGISWTHRPGTKGETWNPVVGCARVSPGCEHCYAESMAARIVAMGGKGAAAYKGLVTVRSKVSGQRYENPRAAGSWEKPRWSGDVRMQPDRLDMPLRATKPRTYFVNSMSDLFHADVTNEFIAAVFGVMAACPQHTFIILTKRAERLPEWFGWLEQSPVSNGGNVNAARGARWYAWNHIDDLKVYGPSQPWVWPLPNVQLGVSAENQEWFDKRVHYLRQVPAAVRLVSLEPLLGPIDAGDNLGTVHPIDGYPDGSSLPGSADIDWVIVGGESGADRRECEPTWIDSIVTQCADAGVSCFVKQDSAFKPGQQGRLSDATWAVKQWPAVRP